MGSWYFEHSAREVVIKMEIFFKPLLHLRVTGFIIFDALSFGRPFGACNIRRNVTTTGNNGDKNTSFPVFIFIGYL